MKNKKSKPKTSASDILNMLEFLHSGISWLPEGKAHKTKVGAVDISYDPKTCILEFKGPVSWVSVSAPNENTAKRLISSIKPKILEARGTNDILESLHQISKETPEIEVISFWGL